MLWMLTSHNATCLEASALSQRALSVGNFPKQEGLLSANNVTNSSSLICKGFLNSTSVNFVYCNLMYVFDFIYSLGHIVYVCFTLKHSITQ